MKKTMPCDVANPGPGLGQEKYGEVKPVNGNPPHFPS